MLACLEQYIYEICFIFSQIVLLPQILFSIFHFVDSVLKLKIIKYDV